MWNWNHFVLFCFSIVYIYIFQDFRVIMPKLLDALVNTDQHYSCCRYCKVCHIYIYIHNFHSKCGYQLRSIQHCLVYFQCYQFDIAEMGPIRMILNLKYASSFTSLLHAIYLCCIYNWNIERQLSLGIFKNNCRCRWSTTIRERYFYYTTLFDTTVPVVKKSRYSVFLMD